MQSMFQDDPHLMGDPVGTLEQMRLAGAGVVKVAMRWDHVAPNPKQRKAPRGFKASDPRSYPGRNWQIYDTIVRDAAADGMAVNFDLGEGAPIWATGSGAPRNKPYWNWEPSASAFGQFVRAVAIRYSGHFTPQGQKTPLPRISNWAVWSEPNLGYSLAPQGVPGNLRVQNSGRLYRALLDAAWNALHATGHGNDTILFGDLGPRGSTNFGVFAAMKPLIFMEALYCVDSRFHQLRGFAATERGCPSTASASRRFRAQHPALFKASGLALHLWARWYRPTVDPQHDPNYAGFPDLPHFQRALDAIVHAYGSPRHLSFYNTEFGYITNPPNHSAPFVSPTTASYYLNWAEYISWRSPRMQSFAQFILQDLPPPKTGEYTFWSAGLFSYTGEPKLTYSAWRLPLFLPVSSTTRGRTLEVWGCVRPGTYAFADTGQPQTAEILFEPKGSSSYSSLRTVTITRNCYFDVRVKFPSSGSVRLAWQYPTGDPLLGNFPAANPSATGADTDPLLGNSATGDIVDSRTVQVTIK
jgi:hypothetical protein